MIVEIEYRNQHGETIEAVKKIPDVEQGEIEKYIKQTDSAVRKLVIKKVSKH